MAPPRRNVQDRVRNLASGRPSAEEQLLRGTGAAKEGEREEGRAAARLRPAPDRHSAPTPAAPVPVGEEDVLRVAVPLPASVVDRAKAQLRPSRTGARRTLAAPLLFQAYVRALDELGLDVDMRGLQPDAADEALDRVRAALRARLR